MISSRHALLALLAGLGLSSSVFAGASNKNPNPFGNGSYFSQNGTFSAVLRSPEKPNFLGVVQVSTTTASYNSTNVTNGAPGTGWATVFTPAIPNYENVVASSGVQRVTNQVPATTNVVIVTNSTTNYNLVNVTNVAYVTNSGADTNITITNTNVSLLTNLIPFKIPTTNVTSVLVTNASNNTITTNWVSITNDVTRTNIFINLVTNTSTAQVPLPSNQLTAVNITNVLAIPYTVADVSTNYITSPAYTYIGPDTNVAVVTVTNVYTNAYITNITATLVTNATIPTNGFVSASGTNIAYTVYTNITYATFTNVVFTNYWTNIYNTNYGSLGVVYSTNYLNVPGIQWNGSAFGVINNNNNQIAVTYTLSSSVSQVYTNNNNITQLSLTNLNGGGQFSANFQNSYPNQTFSGSGYCSVQPTIGGNPSNNSPILNFTNTVSGFRLSY